MGSARSHRRHWLWSWSESLKVKCLASRSAANSAHILPADSLERTLRVHDVTFLGVSARRGPVLWVSPRSEKPRLSFLRCALTFGAPGRSLVMDMPTTQSCRNHRRPRRATPEIADSGRLRAGPLRFRGGCRSSDYGFVAWRQPGSGPQAPSQYPKVLLDAAGFRRLEPAGGRQGRPEAGGLPAARAPVRGA
jgi:hypothetical protein